MSPKRRVRKPVVPSKPLVVIVADREVKAIPIPRSALGKVYDFLAGLVKAP